MAVTELALLHLKNHQEIPPETKSNLASGAAAQARFSGYPVRLYAQVEDPSYIYLVGGWDSVSQHMNDWIPSATNQDIMSSLLSEMELVWMFHVDVEPPKEGICSDTTPLDAPILAVERYFVDKGKKAEFKDSMGRVKCRVEECTAPRMVRAGWRIDYAEGREDTQEEFVMFSGWESMGDHLRFVETSKGTAWMKDSMEEVEVRHARLMELITI